MGEGARANSNINVIPPVAPFPITDEQNVGESAPSAVRCGSGLALSSASSFERLRI